MEHSFQETDLFMSMTLQANAALGQILSEFTDLIYRSVVGFLGRPLRGASTYTEQHKHKHLCPQRHSKEGIPTVRVVETTANANDTGGSSVAYKHKFLRQLFFLQFIFSTSRNIFVG